MLEKEKKGYPSIDKPWEKWYPKEALDFSFPKAKAYDLVYEENKNRKNNIALEYEGNTISYGELFEKVESRTRFFVSEGIKSNSVVTIAMLMTPEFVYDWYALGRLNVISNLIDPRTSVNGIVHYLEEAESDYILCTDLFISKIKKAIGNKAYKIINYNLRESSKTIGFELGVISILTKVQSSSLAKKDKRIVNYSNEEGTNIDYTKCVLPQYNENQALTIVHTGGTTGFPKGVVLSHDNYNAMAYEYKKSQIGFSEGDRFLLIMPPWISYGSGMLHMSLVTGMKATIISKLDSKKMADYLIKYQPQWFAGVPAHYKIIVNSPIIAKKGVPFLKAGAVGGDAMPATLYERVNNYLIENGAKQGVYPGYALTEVTSAFAVKQLGDYKPGSVGIPLPGCIVGIFSFDENTGVTSDEELKINETGEICMRTPNQMLGYFKELDKTKEVLQKHRDGFIWVHTGDLGHIDVDGFIYVDGRIKEMITRYDGFKIYPSVIEKTILSNSYIDQCKVVGVIDKKNGHGQVPMAYIVLKSGNERNPAEIIKDIKELCKKTLPEYYVENMLVDTIDVLPLTAIGKVDYRKLEELGNVII